MLYFHSMENFNNVERSPEQSFEAFAKLLGEVYATESESLPKAFEVLKVEYGEDFSPSSLASLFGANFSEMFRAVDTEDSSYDAEQEEWKRSQMSNISQLCMELKNASDEQSKEEVARELVDYLVNV
jgi:hypothetical protein